MTSKFNYLYIATTPRSGSTLIAQQLGIHSNIFHLGETAYWELLDFKDIRCSCGEESCTFLENISDEIKSEHLAKPILNVWQITENTYWPGKKIGDGSIVSEKLNNSDVDKIESWVKRCPRALEKIISIYKKFTCKEVFIDNSKLTIIAKELLNYPKWGVILLFRDPRGILSSYKMSGIKKGDFRSIESVLPFLEDFVDHAKEIKGREDVISIRYEDFCLHTEGELKRICNFIEVNFEENMLSIFTKNRDFRGHVIKGNRILKAKDIDQIKEDVKWKEVLTEEELRKLYEYKNGKLLKFYRKLGYILE